VSLTRVIAALFAVFFAHLVVSARVTLFPGLAVPAVVPFATGAVAVVALAVWLICRRARRFRSCPHPHPAWGTR
jgi:hypothetical protein